MKVCTILNPEIQKYIHANLKSDLHFLLLKKSPFPDVSMQEIVQQIKGKIIAEKKFPLLLKKGIIFPPHLNLEQASSQSTAEYKAKLVKGKNFVDLTSGFGIDALFLSQNFEKTTLVEKNQELLEIVTHNWKILNKEADFINENLHDFLNQNKQQFDLIFLDPARRDEHNNKVFLLGDLSPDLIEIQEQLLKFSNKVLIKLSPLIDISYLVSTLKNITQIHIVAVKNEVKEILVLINSNKKSDKISINSINLETEETIFKFNFNEEKNAISEFSEPLKYLYIPNNAILKAGAFNLISEKFNLKKLHPNTHLYTSESLVQEFPGRILEIQIIEKKELKKNDQFNILSKNFPLKPEQIKKKFQLRDGGEHYLIFTQSTNGKIIVKSV